MSRSVYIIVEGDVRTVFLRVENSLIKKQSGWLLDDEVMGGDRVYTVLTHLKRSGTPRE